MTVKRVVASVVYTVAGLAVLAGVVAHGSRQAREERRVAASASAVAPAAVTARGPSAATPAPTATTARPKTGPPPAGAARSVAGRRALTKKGKPIPLRERFREKMRETTRGDKLGEEGPRGPSGFDAWFYGQRAFPAARIPKGARAKALRSALKTNARRPPAEGGAQADLPLPYWVPLGPSTIPDGQTDDGAGAALSPVSGRLQAIAVDPTDPDVVYAGGAQGGVWKTTNATSATPSWTPLTDREASLAIGAIAIDPKDHLVVYVGTGESAGACDSYYGAGILKTTDGGATWTLLGGEDGGPFRNYAVSNIVVDPVADTVWASTTLGFFSSGTAQCDVAPTASNGGLWRSDDGGATWAQQDVPAGAGGSAQIHDLALDPDDLTGNTLYVAVRSVPTAANGGVWKSTDAKGAPATFNKVATGFANTALASPGVRRITLGIGGPGSGGTLYAALAASNDNLWGVYKSTDGGASWAHLDDGNTGTATVTGGSRTVSRLTGPSFTSLMVGRRIILDGRFSRTVETVVNGNSLRFSSFESTLSGSTLSGIGWSVATYPNYCDGQCSYDMTVGVDPQDADVVYVGGNGQRFNDDKAAVGASCRSFICPEHSLWRSDDGGLTWAGVSQGDGVTGGLHVDDHALAFDASVSPSPSRVYDGNDGGIWRSEDKGGSWTSMNTDIAITQFQSVGLHPSDPRVVIGGTQDNGTNVLNPAFETPPAWFHADFGDGGQAIIDQSDPQRMLHTYFNQSYDFMGPAKSTIGGAGGPGSWDFVGAYYGYGSYYYNGMDPTDPVSFYAPLAQHPAYAPNVVYFGSSKLYRSPDPQIPGGVESWTVVSPDLTKSSGCNPLLGDCPFLSAIGVHPRLIAAQEVIYTGASDGRIAVSKTINALTTAASAVWTVIDKAPLPARFVTDIEVAESDATGNTAYVTFSGFNSSTPSTPGHVFKTTNGLAASPTWTDVTGDLPDVPANAVALLPTATGDQLFVGTDVGVFWSDNGGTNWTYLNDGHPVVAVFALDRSRTTGQIVSSTHGRGMFELRDRPPTGPPDNTAPVCGGSFDGGDPSKFNGNATDNVGIARVQFLPGVSPDLSLGSIRYSGAASVTYVVTNGQVGCASEGAVQVTDGAGYFCRTPITFAGNPIPAAPVAQNNGPVTAGQPLQLTASTVPGASYSWTGPDGFTSTAQNPLIAASTAAKAGTYTVTVTVGGCTSAQASTTVKVRPMRSDFNGDGKPDIVLRNQTTGAYAVWFMNGPVRVGGGDLVPGAPADTAARFVGTADFDDDGQNDILFQSTATGDFTVWYMNGLVRTGTATTTPTRPGSPSWWVVALDDFDANGSADFVFENQSTRDIVIWYMGGTVRSGGVGLVPSRPGDGSFRIAGVTDFNADGKPDIVFQHQTAGDIVVWYLEGAVRVGGSGFTPTRPGTSDWKIKGVADLDADTDPDLLWQHQTLRDLVYWYVDGTTKVGGAGLSPIRPANTAYQVIGIR